MYMNHNVNPAVIYITYVASSHLSLMNLIYLYQFSICKQKIGRKPKSR